MRRIAIGLLLASLACGAAAQSYPNHPIRIVTGGAGGGSDFTLRLIAQGLIDSFGQQVVVDNRGGASGALAVQSVSRAAPDGHTLLYYSSSLWIVPLLQNVPWDAVRDFAPVTLTAMAPNLVVVHPALPVNSIRDLIALARARPGTLNYGSGVTGSSLHLAAELFKSMAGVNIVQINYKGVGPAVTDLIAGQLQVMFVGGSPVMSHIKSGRLHALAVTSAQRSAIAPELPTVAESGLTGFETAAVYAMFAPAGTPLPVVSRLQQEIVHMLAQSGTKEKFLASGVEAIGSAPDELTAAMKADIARFGKLIKSAGIRVD